MTLRAILFLAISLHAIALGKSVHHDLKIATTPVAPDCTLRTAPTVNGQLPGPLLRGVWNDTLNVRVENQLAEDGYAMHWHGIRHRGSPWEDGTPWVAQVPIAPKGGVREYTMTLDEPGTYYYHAHTKFHASTAHGVLVVEDPADKQRFGYTDERVLLLSEWAHTDENAHASKDDVLMSPVQTPPTVLINGHALTPLGVANVCNATDGHSAIENCVAGRCQMAEINVKANVTYRFRLVHAGGANGYRVSVNGHALTVIEADGRLVKPLDVQELDLYPGQRYSFLLTTNQPASSYHVAVAVADNPKLKAAAVMHYEEAGTQAPVHDAAGAFKTLNETVSSEIKETAVADLLTPHVESGTQSPPASTQTLVLKTLWANETHWVNRQKYQAAERPLLHMAYQNKSAMATDRANVYHYPLGTVLDIVIENQRGSCGSHPWHLHGHFFWDMGGGPGHYHPSNVSSVFHTTPVQRDTMLVRAYPKHDTSVACGFRVFRVVLDNVGFWHMHCHIHDHMMDGLQVIIAAGANSTLPTPPAHIKAMLMDDASFTREGVRSSSGISLTASSAVWMVSALASLLLL